MRYPWPAPHQRASLRTRLMALSLAALLPGFCVLGVTEYEVRLSRQIEVQDLSIRTATQAAFVIDRMFAGMQVLLIAVSRISSVQRLDQADCTSYLVDLGQHLANVTTISLLDKTGQFRCGSNAGPPPVGSFADRPYFRDALASSRPVVGDYTLGAVSGRPVLPIALAVRDGAGQPIGVLVASIDLSWLGEQLRRRGLPPGGSLTVADRRGVIIAREPLSDQFVGTKIPDAYMRLVNASAPGSETVISQDGTRRVLGYVPSSDFAQGVYVSAGLSAEVSYQAVDRATRRGALLAIGAGLATLAATWVIGSRAFLRPIRRLTDVLDRWRAGEATLRTGFAAGTGEIGALGAALDRMMDESAASQAQRDLLANELAHRVKNTLATVQAIATSTLNKPVPAQDILPDFLTRIAALARTHEVLTRDRWESADLGDLARGVVRPLVGDGEARFRIEGPPVELPPREALGLTMVLHELCTNALKYGALTRASGQVDLTWSAMTTPDGLAIDLLWRESGGPPVEAPIKRSGFGTRLMARALGEGGRTALNFEPAGLRCRAELLILAAGRSASS